MRVQTGTEDQLQVVRCGTTQVKTDVKLDKVVRCGTTQMKTDVKLDQVVRHASGKKEYVRWRGKF